MSDVIVSDNDFSKEMEVIKEEEISTRDSVSGSMWNKFRSEYFSNHLSIPVIGTQDSISKITKEEIQEFHSKFCNKDQAVICLSANMTRKNAVGMLRDVFGKQNGKILRTKMTQSKYKKTRTEVFTRSDIEHTFVWMGMPNKSNEDVRAEAYLINSILSSGMDSRLFEEVREKRGLVYSIGSSFNNMKSGNFNLVSYQTRDKNKDEVMSIVKDQIFLIQDKGFTEEEIVRAKNKARTSFYKETETGSGMVHNIFSSTVNKDPTVEQMMDKINRLTNEDLIFASNIMFDMDKCLNVICKGDK